MVKCGKGVRRVNKFVGKTFKYALFMLIVFGLVVIALINPYVAVVGSVVGGFFLRELISKELDFISKKMNRVDEFDYITCKGERE
jgi:type IV secretory pathway VirB3-like protein